MVITRIYAAMTSNVTLALIILAVIGGMFKGTVDGWFWVFLVAKVAFLGFLIVFLYGQ